MDTMQFQCCVLVNIELGLTLNRVHTIQVTENIHPRTPYAKIRIRA